MCVDEREAAPDIMRLSGGCQHVVRIFVDRWVWCGGPSDGVKRPFLPFYRMFSIEKPSLLVFPSRATSHEK